MFVCLSASVGCVVLCFSVSVRECVALCSAVLSCLVLYWIVFNQTAINGRRSR